MNSRRTSTFPRRGLPEACETSCVTDTEKSRSSSNLPNHLVTVLLVIGGLALFIAFLLWLVHGQVTDWSTYDVAAANTLALWTGALAVLGVMALAGAIVRSRIRRAARHPNHN